MDFSQKPSRSNPYAKANLLSRLFFWWLLPLFQQGRRVDLEVGDMFDTLQDDESAPLGDRLEDEWNKEKAKCKLGKKRNKSPSVASALFSQLGINAILGSFGVLFGELVFRISQPVLLRQLIKSFSEDSSISRRDQYLYAAGVSLTTLGLTLCYHTSAFYLLRIAMRCRLGLSSLIYRKALRLSTSTQHQTNVGVIVNLLSNDVNRFDQSLIFIVFMPMGVIQLFAYSYMLWSEFGMAAMSGVGLLLILMPIQYLNGKLSAKYRLQIAQRADNRGQAMNEIIIGIRILKMYAWERPFSALIQRLRKVEVQAIRKRLYLRGFYLTLTHSAVKILLFVTITAYVMSGNELSADKVFFTSAVYHNLSQIWTYVIPSGISAIGETNISLNRIKKFLLLDEKQTGGNLLCREATSKPNVTLSHASAKWTENNGEILKCLNTSLSGDSTVIVAGPCGSGKSSFLQVLLGELSLSSGTCGVQGRVSYAAQESWIFAGSVKQNILFGREYDSEKYKRVIEAAALLDDFKQLPNGEATIVGDRGISLSGGQKARVNLARCLYQDADIYLLDDPLSAVDTKVSRHLYEKCIKKHLAGKLRILVTHQLQYLPQADRIILLKNGSIMAQGTYDELAQQNIDFVSLMMEDDDDEQSSHSRKASLIREETKAANDNFFKRASIQYQSEDDSSPEPKMKEESRATGSVGFRIYYDYLKLGRSLLLFITTLVLFALCQACMTAADYWLSIWTNAEQEHSDHLSQQQDVITSTDDDKYLGRNTYIYVFTGLVAAVLSTNLLRAVAFFNYSMRIGIHMHDAMFSSLIRAVMKFFDENPSGRVMNRFTKDLGSMDELLPPALFDMLIIFSQVAGVIVVIITSNYYVAPPALLVLMVLWLIRRYYVSTARDVKRIEGITKSPIFTHSAATFSGLTTIRALHAEPILIEQFDALQDIHTSSWFVFFSAMRCFGIWIELISVIFLTFVSFSFLITQDSVPMGNVGLAISSAMTLSSWLQYGMRQSAEVENNMTSVERNLEYTQLPSEEPTESLAGKMPPKGWPSAGAMSFQSVSLSYGEKDVLKQLTFDVKPREKIGIVGRTGAGKSSIIQALFRLTEPSGKIFIDDVKISEIGLHDLRKGISIIPQEPILFSGTMRYNLDPFNEYPDDELWEALTEVQLKNAVPALDYMVNDGGSNFSVGQRQLVCLARAILRQNRIIVMDEATANVDPETDMLIQKTVRSKFAQCTILTVAHRLQTVIDCDRILVLDNGYLKEYNHPHVLLQKPHGIFAGMVSRTGKSSSNLLRKISAETYNGRRESFKADTLSLLSTIETEDGDVEN